MLRPEPVDEDAAGQKMLALLREITAANGYADLPPQQRLARFDSDLIRLQALGPEVAETRSATIHEQLLHSTQEERARVAMQLARDPFAASGMEAGPNTDFEWLGQRTLTALGNPLQRQDFQASLARGIDFNVGVSGIAQLDTGWLVQLTNRFGQAGTPGQGFFCWVATTDSASLAVLRGVTPGYAIVHASASSVDEFTMPDDPPRVRIVFDDCRITPPSDGPHQRPCAGFGSPNQAAAGMAQTGDAARGASDATGEPVAPSPVGLRCEAPPLRRREERPMVHRLRQAWAIPDALRDDPSLSLTFAVTLNFDAELTEPPQLTRSQSRRATSGQLRAAAEAAKRAITTTAPFPELIPFAGGTMQVEMTPCD